jgi:hypothetical protein
MKHMGHALLLLVIAFGGLTLSGTSAEASVIKDKAGCRAVNSARMRAKCMSCVRRPRPHAFHVKNAAGQQCKPARTKTGDRPQKRPKKRTRRSRRSK